MALLEDALANDLENIAMKQSFGVVQEEMEEALSQTASLKRAKAYRLKHSVSDWSSGAPEQYSVLRTSSRDLGDYSIGLELYFLYIKQLTFIFLIVSIFSISPVVSNFNGRFLPKGEILNKFSFLTLANQKGMQLRKYDHIDSALEEAEDMLTEINSNYIEIWVINACYSSIFLVLVLASLCYGNRMIKKNLQKKDLVTDFSVKVKGLPLYMVRASEVQEHFSMFGEVVEVYLARIYKQILFDYRKRAQYQKKLLKLFYDLQNKNKDPNSNSKYLKIKHKIKDIDEKIGKIRTHQHHNDLPIKKAYVIFNNKADRNRCLKVYNKCFGLKQQSNRLMFRGSHKLTVSPAPDPSNILWENLEISKWERFLRSLLAKSVLFVFMIISFALVYYIKTEDEDIPTISKCTKFNYDFSKLSFHEAETLLDTQTEVSCWCEQVTLEEMARNSSIREYCSNFIQKSINVDIIRRFTSIGVIIVNLSMRIIIKKLIKLERISNLSSVQVRIMLRIFIAVSINTAIVTLLVNIDFSSLPVISEYLFTGSFLDFTRDWYVRVGSIFLYIGIISIFSPHLIVLLILFPINWIGRHCCFRRFSNQYDMNRAFLGKKFDIAGRMASINSLVFLCFLYSGGIPLLNIICLCALFTIYWTDKFLILRYYRKPPYYNQSMYLASISCLYLCVCLHCLVSAYMFGCPEIFPDGFDTDGHRLVTESKTVFQRLFNYCACASDAITVFAAAFYLFSLFFAGISKFSLRRIKKYDERNFKDCLKGNCFKGLVSYKITHNPAYALLINAMNEANRYNRMTKIEEMKEFEPQTPSSCHDYVENIDLLQMDDD